MTRSELEQLAAFNCNLDNATIDKASDSELVAVLREWLGAGDCSDSDVLELLRDSDWNPEMATG
jgi:hypothetical protein